MLANLLAPVTVIELDRLELSSNVVGILAIVFGEIHETVAFDGTVHLAPWRVSRQKLIVHPEPVSRGIGVRKHSGLEHRVWTGLNAWHHVARAKGGLLDFSKPICWIAVENHAAGFAKGIRAMRPDLGHVEDVKRGSRNVVWMNGLHVHVPRGEVARFDGALEIHKVPVGLGSRQFSAFSVGEVMDALIGDEMNADIMIRPVGFGEFVGVAAVSVHMAYRRWKPSVAEEEHQSMDTFLVVNVKVPKHVSIGCIGARVPFVASVYGREFDRIANEEDRLEGGLKR